MNYKVIVAESVRDFLDTLSPTIRAQVYRQLLVDLPADPDRLLGPHVVPYANKFPFSVTAQDRPEHPNPRWFVFYVDRGSRRRTWMINGGRYGRMACAGTGSLL